MAKRPHPRSVGSVPDADPDLPVGRTGPSAPHPAVTGPLPRPVRWLLVLLGCLSLAVGVVGIILPLLPTTPFLLLTAGLFAAGNRRLHDWLVHHPRLGPPLVAWWEHGAVPLRAKFLATIMIAGSMGATVMWVAEGWLLRLLLVSIAVAVLAWLWARPLPPPPARLVIES